MTNKITITAEQAEVIESMSNEGKARTMLHLFNGYAMPLITEARIKFLKEFSKGEATKLLFEEGSYVIEKSFEEGDWVLVESLFYDTFRCKIEHKSKHDYKLKSPDFMGERSIRSNVYHILRHLTKEESIKAEQDMKWKDVKAGDIIQLKKTGALGVFASISEDGVVELLRSKHNRQAIPEKMCEPYDKEKFKKIYKEEVLGND